MNTGGIIVSVPRRGELAIGEKFSLSKIGNFQKQQQAGVGGGVWVKGGSFH